MAGESSLLPLPAARNNEPHRAFKKNNEPHLVRVFHGPILMERGWGDLRLDRPIEVLGGLSHYLDLQELQNA